MRWQLASTFAAVAMSGCFKESTVPCPNGVLCPADQACTGNAPSDDLKVKLCALEGDVVDCEGKAERDNCDGTNGPGLCINRFCEPCRPELYECYYDSWTPVPSPDGLNLNAVFMLAPDRAFAVGGLGATLTYDGEQWSQGIHGVATDTMKSYEGVWATGTTVYVASYEAIVTSDGLSVPVVPSSATLNGLWGRAPDDIVAVAKDEVIGSFNGSWSWTTPGFGSLNAAWGWADGAVAVGVGGAVYTRAGAEWTRTEPNPVPDDFVAVWGASKMDYYAVGNGNNGLNGRIWHYTGTWTDETPGAIPPLNGVWGSDDGRVYAVGQGTILIKAAPGSAWAPMATPDPAVHLVAISGLGRAAIAVGATGEIWRIAPTPAQ